MVARAVRSFFIGFFSVLLVFILALLILSFIFS
jgi:hypothetical protein